MAQLRGRSYTHRKERGSLVVLSKDVCCCWCHPVLNCRLRLYLLVYCQMLQKRAPLSSKYCLHVQPLESTASTLTKSPVDSYNFSGLLFPEINTVQPSKFTSLSLQDYNHSTTNALAMNLGNSS